MSEPFPSPAGSHRPDSSTTPSVDSTTAAQSVAVMRFKSCRWRRPPDEGTECCGHRDVLPIAGTTGFDPEAWCPECSFYKLRRTPKKRSPDEYRY
jgi:hypothetical protein